MTATATSPTMVATDNPYVGPRSFKTGEKMYGRDRELQDLLNLLIAERIVLLYSPSGAGKSSLIHAGLIGQLRKEGFRPLPVMRVSLQPENMPQNANRYLLSAKLSLEEHDDELDNEAQRTHNAESLAAMTLAEYLGQRPKAADGLDISADEEVLIFDQFEEVLTLDPVDTAAKQEFFKQVGEALRNRSRWALFAMREEYRAALDPYLRYIPNGLSVTFRLDLLGIQAARDAIQKPARDAGVDFTSEAADKLVNDLCKVLVAGPEGKVAEVPGLYVEPVQLQVVCRNLWVKWKERLAANTGKLTDPTKITLTHLDEVGDVNNALGDYYSLCVGEAARQSNVTEREIRDWVGTTLITSSGIRGQVLEDPHKGAGLDKTAIDALKNDYLVRPEQRRGVTWYELAHDRLIEPVTTNNKKWFEQNLSTFQKQAALWASRNRVGGLLIGEALKQEEAWLREHPEVKLTPEDQDFLAECRKADYTRRKTRAVSRIIFLLFIASLLAVGYALRVNWKLHQQQKQLEATSLAFDELQAHNAKIELAARENGAKLPTNAIDNHPPFPVTKAGEPLGSGAKAQGADPSAAANPSATASASPVATPAKPGGITITLGSPAATPAKSGGINITLGSSTSDITGRYFKKDVDVNRVNLFLSTLKGRYKTEVAPSAEGLADVPTNCIWYGSGVNIEEAKFVAFRLVAAGIQIKAIKPMRSPTEGTRTIEISGESSWLYSKPLTVEQIRNCVGQCPQNNGAKTAY
ncbi:MAG: ATP-binding protein [Acidobacteriota bacterium]|nr:ATP-binding protein [Acidobacteriota bacterium]